MFQAVSRVAQRCRALTAGTWTHPATFVAREGADERLAVEPSAVSGEVPSPGSEVAHSGRPWGHLRLIELVGRGSFGEVHRAYDPQLDRHVALKLLARRSETGTQHTQRVLSEGRLLARVRHPNIVTIYGTDVHDDHAGIWMEFIKGVTLEARLQRDGPCGAQEALFIGQDVCRALAAVHGAGLLHRDVKAQNVMREEGGRIVLMDFGTAELQDAIAASRRPRLAGTPLYVAPEVLAGAPPSVQSDLYSVGVLLFHLVTGKFPVEADSISDLCLAHADGRRTFLQDARADLPDAFARLVERALSPDPRNRYPSAGAMQAPLAQAAGTEQPSHEPRNGHRLLVAALPNKAPRLVQFGTFEMDLSTGELTRHGQRVPLQDQPARLLAVLVSKPGQIVTREELRRALWSEDTFDEFASGLNAAIKRLRAALGDSASVPRFIETVPKRGYRFVADVRHPSPQPPDRQRLAARLGLLLVLLFVSTVLFAWWTSSRTSRTASSSVSTKPTPALSANTPTLAVLPFLSVDDGARDEALEVGMAQTVISKLMSARRLVVRPIDVVHQYRERTRDPHAIAQELKVDFVLDGTVQREGERLRVGVQFVAASDRRVLWADAFDEGFTNIFDVQDRIAQRVTRALAIELTSPERARMMRRYTDSVELYELYLRGNYSRLRLTRDGILTAIDYYKRTLARDPGYALAWEGLSQAYSMAAWWRYLSPEDVQPRIREAAQRAIAIDPDLAHAQLAFGSYLTTVEWDWSSGRRALERALQLAPNHWEAHHLYANYLVMVGDIDAALAARRRAADLNPFELRSTWQLSVTLMLGGRHQEALAHSLRIRESDPQFAGNYFTLSQIYLDLGRPDEAFKALIQWQTVSKDPEYDIARLERAFQTGGWRGLRKEQLRQELEQERSGKEMALALAARYAQLGDKDRAFLWLDRAVARREQYVVYVKSMPPLAPLRSDPRFARLLRRMNLPDNRSRLEHGLQSQTGDFWPGQERSPG